MTDAHSLLSGQMNNKILHQTPVRFAHCAAGPPPASPAQGLVMRLGAVWKLWWRQSAALGRRLARAARFSAVPLGLSYRQPAYLQSATTYEYLRVVCRYDRTGVPLADNAYGWPLKHSLKLSYYSLERIWLMTDQVPSNRRLQRRHGHPKHLSGLCQSKNDQVPRDLDGRFQLCLRESVESNSQLRLLVSKMLGVRLGKVASCYHANYNTCATHPFLLVR